MNIIDFLIIILIIVSALRGFQVGSIRQLFSTVGFILGLIIGVPLGKYFSWLSTDPGTQSLIATVILFALSFILMTIGEAIGVRIRSKFASRKFAYRTDNYLGSGIAVLTLGVGIWFAVAFAALLPSSGMVKTARNSLVFNLVDRNLPPASQALAGLNHFINPNDAPLIFSGREPSPDTKVPLPPLSEYQAIVQASSQSIVRVQGLGCGGIVNGTGFALTSDRIVTNAHVVAGIRSPKVYDRYGTHDTTVVHFDPDMDLAVLQVRGLRARPLPLKSDVTPNGSTTLVIGYPGGGAEEAQTSRVHSHVRAIGRDIYGKARTERNVYIMQTKLIPGNSGGPVLDTEGKVVGVVFGTSTSYSDVGYALSTPQLLDIFDQAKTARNAVSTGSCGQV